MIVPNKDNVTGGKLHRISGEWFCKLKVLDVFSIYSLLVSSFVYYIIMTLYLLLLINLSNWKSDSSIFNTIL